MDFSLREWLILIGVIIIIGILVDGVLELVVKPGLMQQH